MTVDTLALDDLGIEQLAAMKVDVERGEPLVLKGARETLKRCRPELLIEVLARPRAMRFWRLWTGSATSTRLRWTCATGL
jgi:hypothetical protein